MKGTRTYPVGAGTYSKHPDRYAEGAPRRVTWANGAWVGDDLEFADGLVDLTSGMGAVILGHQHPAVDVGMIRQLHEGVAFPLPSHLEQAVANRLLDLLTWERAEAVRFGKNGADVTATAVRLARAVTGRRFVFFMDYHGHHDWSMTEAPWNAGIETQASVRYPRAGLADNVRDLKPAAVILEPWPSAPGVDGAMDWADLRHACDEAGTLLILDEMVSGFRAAPGGGAELFGIEPDLACYGKAMANGMPLSAIVGPYDILKRYEEDVFFSLTHAGEAVSLAAAHETLGLIQDGRALADVAFLGAEIITAFLRAGALHSVKYGYTQRLLFDFTRAELGLMLQHKVLCAGYANLTLAHCRDQVARGRILEAVEIVLERRCKT